MHPSRLDRAEKELVLTRRTKQKKEDTLGESLLWRGVGAGLDRTEQEQGQGQSQGRARAGPEKAQSRLWTAKEGSGEAQKKLH